MMLLELVLIGMNVAILVMLVMLLNRKEKYVGHPTAGAPMYVGCGSECGPFLNKPTNDNLTSRNNPMQESCADCMTNSWGIMAMDCPYANNYAEGSLSTDNLCDAWGNVQKNCGGDSITMNTWGNAAKAMKCS